MKKPNSTIDAAEGRVQYIDMQREMIRRMLRYSKGIERAAVGQQSTLRTWMTALDERDSGPDGQSPTR